MSRARATLVIFVASVFVASAPTAPAQAAPTAPAPPAQAAPTAPAASAAQTAPTAPTPPAQTAPTPPTPPTQTAPTAPTPPVTSPPASHLSHLPPQIPWSGASEKFQLPADDPWATPFEQSGGLDSPDYDTTVRWLQHLVESAPELTMVSLGASPEGREIWAVIASTEGATNAAAVKASGRPTLFAHAGIHSGEIDGKDAGMMLLRDMTVRGNQRALIEQVNFVFVPIFSVDAHERRSEHSRINQRGPRVQGWRTTARNLNLNRDYTKADALEMRHMLRALEAFDPDLYLDLHVTDGADYAYDITYGFNGEHGWSPAIARWLNERYRPFVDARLEEMGHIPGPLIFVVDQNDIRKGMVQWTAGPRFSNGYGDARHLPTVLLENHSLKPFRQRVLGTYVFLEANLRVLAEYGKELRRVVAEERAARPDSVHLAYAMPAEPLGTIDFRAVRERTRLSEISGRLVPEWTGETITVTIPVVGNAARDRMVALPEAWWIPAAWSDLGSLLDLHGIAYEVVEDTVEVEVVSYRLPDAKIADEPFEGRVRVDPGEPVIETGPRRFLPGALRVPADQPLRTLAALLLEPLSEDSIFQWGGMLEILQRTEYFEAYVLEPMARAMMEEDPGLRAAFEERLTQDEDFAGDARARLEFFYQRTPYFDDRWKLYPIARQERGRE